ncbi:hypothetical protein [Cobetia amphilecti]|uniref:hypothetical protein n=1 Tax=Cobetia amphilecti TaxID=1055104 RepID=UPI001C09FB97|nr:hypothetical protein [Cobetia amphilecti]MBU3007656.1 hypothetical protein [Cobetia amphilecti]
MSFLRVLLIAIFLTASLRLLPLPFSDTVRHALLAFVIFLSGASRRSIDLSFIKIISPILVFFIGATILDVVLMRFGFYSQVFWAQLCTAILVANTVYKLTVKESKNLIIYCVVILLLQLIFLTLQPRVFASLGHLIGIADPFVLYGKKLERIYYAYYQANGAAYTIFYMFLAWFAIRQRMSISSFEFILVASILFVLALLTGGRGVLLLMVTFVLIWPLAFKKTRTVTAVVLYIGVMLFSYLIYALVSDLYYSREVSNAERLGAIHNYFNYIMSNPLHGMGIDYLRFRVEEKGDKPSHVFFIEVLGTYGILIGALVLFMIMNFLILRPRLYSLKLIGGFALMVGFFNNTLLTTWAFIPLVVPVLIATQNELRRNAPSNYDLPTSI